MVEIIQVHQIKVIRQTCTKITQITTNNFISNTINNVDSVLLQTAKATASGLNDLSFVNIQIIFDSGSQRTYANDMFVVYSLTLYSHLKQKVSQCLKKIELCVFYRLNQ